MARGILAGLALAAAALAVTTASFADGKAPADVVHAYRFTTNLSKLPQQGVPMFPVPDEWEEICFLDRNVICALQQQTLVVGAGPTPPQAADAHFSEESCKTVSDLLKAPKSALDAAFKVEAIVVPGGFARKAFALAELNQLRDEMTRDIAKQGIDAGVLRVKK